MEWLVKYVDLEKNYNNYKSQINPVIERVLTNGAFILRDDVLKFEKHIAVSCSTGLAVLVYCCGTHCSQIVFNAYDLVSSDKARHACIGCCT